MEPATASPHLHLDKHYPNDQIRHFDSFSGMSVSGQFEIGNFQTLVNRIRKLHPQGAICFIDVRQDTHFVLNNRSVSIKTENNNGKTPDEVVQGEAAWAEKLKGVKRVILDRKENVRLESIEEDVQSTSTVKAFVEDVKYHGEHRHLRFALDEHGPMSDAQVDSYLKLLTTSKSNQTWLHANSVVGGASAKLLALMKDMMEHATQKSLDELQAKYSEGGFMRGPKVDDPAATQKLARIAFLRTFYEYALTHAQHGLSWSEWKKLSQP